MVYSDSSSFIFAAAVLADENLFADLNFHLYLVAVNYAAGVTSTTSYISGLFLRRCRKEDTALGLFLGFRLHEHHSVCQRLEFHHIYLQLNNIQTKNSTELALFRSEC